MECAMSTTLAEADAIVERMAGSRVRIKVDDRTFDGVLQRSVRRPKDGKGVPRFVIFGRSSDWKVHAERFASDPAIYKRALRSFSRPCEAYFPFQFADRIEVVHRTSGSAVP
jgi:hypothetical protein